MLTQKDDFLQIVTIMNYINLSSFPPDFYSLINQKVLETLIL